ncbi:DUF2147 domain-containing protein [Roseateles puraquae]|jgi:uncharacterized protein (DUF2147 family)|uniref:DUF2147 domain-containing protein n=1 Tax=Roseateles puraquae TaxID=431059 RepID=A0A254NDQ9_9BURK|nr:DUF2147 domain-containing protein [Roseateles puraquae]MDG0853647.1 DUF2147 domain-containing protein [Roseateles puraquae]OWR06111.1 hypothetical protein CDO81_06715 [Roseateles puraquae]
MKALIATALLLPGLAFAQATPMGLWKTIDDDGKTAKSLVRITEQGGALVGSIDKLLDPKDPGDAKCDKCKDDRKDQPVVGLQIIRGVKAEGDGIWGGGEILDPNNGKTYRTRLKPVDGGKKLEMRGYIGPFYRTQTWIRVE